MESETVERRKMFFETYPFCVSIHLAVATSLYEVCGMRLGICSHLINVFLNFFIIIVNHCQSELVSFDLRCFKFNLIFIRPRASVAPLNKNYARQ